MSKEIKTYKEQADELIKGCKAGFGSSNCGEINQIGITHYCNNCHIKSKTLIQSGEYFVWLMTMETINPLILPIKEEIQESIHKLKEAIK